LFGKPGNVEEFDSCQRNVRDFTIIDETNKTQQKVTGSKFMF